MDLERELRSERLVLILTPLVLIAVGVLSFLILSPVIGLLPSGLPTEPEAFAEPVWQPIVDDSPGPKYIDLQLDANHALNEPFRDGEAGNDLAELPQGEQVFAGVPFTIGPAMIRLGSRGSPELPLHVEDILIARSFDTLHILHGTEFGSGPPGSPSIVADGTPVGEYRVRYADGQVETVPLVYGIDVRDWWNWDGKPVSRGKVAWQGSNAAAKKNEVKLRLYVQSWKNPRPEQPVLSIDFVAANNVPAPFCLAMTVERMGEAGEGPKPD